MIMKDAKALGIFIKKNRKSQSLTQIQLASISGVGVRFVRELERGKESCHLGKALLILQALGLELHVRGDS